MHRRLQRISRAAAPNGARSRVFRESAHDRFWWHRLPETDYVPSVYATLTDTEWELVEEWFRATEERNTVGEINVPAMCLLQGLVSGSGIVRIVQLGHFYGYSSLLLGFVLRQMRNGQLVSIDISPEATKFTKIWIRRAGLEAVVTPLLGDSAAAESADAAEAVLGGPPQLIVVDSSHAYAHTLRELDLWVQRLPLGGIMALHDTSGLAQEWDPSGEGGVLRALREWLPRHPEVVGMNLNEFVSRESDARELIYRDGCGIGLLQKVSAGQR